MKLLFEALDLFIFLVFHLNCVFNVLSRFLLQNSDDLFFLDLAACLERNSLGSDFAELFPSGDFFVIFLGCSKESGVS